MDLWVISLRTPALNEVCVLLTEVCVCFVRWALSRQEESGRLRSLCCGSRWSKRSWAMTGSALTCSAWEPAAYWLTSRGRWELNTRYFFHTLIFCILVFFFSFVLVFTDLPSRYWTVCSLSWAAYGLKPWTSCFSDQSHRQHTDSSFQLTTLMFDALMQDLDQRLWHRESTSYL